MFILEENNTWDLVQFSFQKFIVGFRLSIVKVNPNGSIALLKARSIAKCYS